MDYVSGLEKLATQLEKEAAIIREFLGKNYGHFDSRYVGVGSIDGECISAYDWWTPSSTKSFGHFESRGWCW